MESDQWLATLINEAKQLKDANNYAEIKALFKSMSFLAFLADHQPDQWSWPKIRSRSLTHTDIQPLLGMSKLFIGIFLIFILGILGFGTMGSSPSVFRRTKGDGKIVPKPSFHGLELYPHRLNGDDNSVKFDEGVQRLESIEELPADRTWLLIRRGDEDHVLWWSPCTGERFMVHVELLDRVRTGLLLEHSSDYFVGSTGLMLDYEERILYATSLGEGSRFMWSFSSQAGEWVATSIPYEDEEAEGEEEQQQQEQEEVEELGKTSIPDEDEEAEGEEEQQQQEQEEVEELGKTSIPDEDEEAEGEEEQQQQQQVEELGKMYLAFECFNPKLKVMKRLPSPAGVGVHLVERETWHWHHGNLYNFGCDGQRQDGNLLVSRWDANSCSWTQVASHAIYSHGMGREPGDFVCVSGGGRYLWATQGTSEHMCWGRFLVVYDLEEDTWHYKTLRADRLSGDTLVLACTKGHIGHAHLDSAFSAVWLQEPCYLSLPRLPSSPSYV